MGLRLAFRVSVFGVAGSGFSEKVHSLGLEFGGPV